MTYLIKVSAETTQIDVAVSAPAAGAYQCRLLNADGVAQQARGATPSFTFTGVAEGDYTAEMSRLDINGDVIPGSVITGTFNTSVVAGPAPTPTPDPAPTVKVDVPSVLTITGSVE